MCCRPVTREEDKRSNTIIQFANHEILLSLQFNKKKIWWSYWQSNLVKTMRRSSSSVFWWCPWSHAIRGQPQYYWSSWCSRRASLPPIWPRDPKLWLETAPNGPVLRHENAACPSPDTVICRRLDRQEVVAAPCPWPRWISWSSTSMISEAHPVIKSKVRKNESTNQSIIHSLIQSIDRSINQSINHLIDRTWILGNPVLRCFIALQKKLGNRAMLFFKVITRESSN